MQRRTTSMFLCALMAPLAGILAATGCSSTATTPAVGCATDADCKNGDACIQQACTPTGNPGPDDGGHHPTCANVMCKDTCCAAGQTCQSGACTSAHPAPPDSGVPDTGVACPSVVCGGTCCNAGQTCRGSACVDPAPDGGSCSTIMCAGACCAAGQTCTNNVCTTPPTCSLPGQSCTTLPCCQAPAGGSRGATCLSDDNACHSKCMSDSECQSGCCARLQNETYGACAAANYCVRGGIGDSCFGNTDCASNRCVGTDEWCTASCSVSNNACAGGHGPGGYYNQYGQLNWCLLNNAGADTCFPGCQTNADCTVYVGTTCKSYNDVTGRRVSICST